MTPSTPANVKHTPTPWQISGATVIWSPDAKAVVAQVSRLRATEHVKFTEPHCGMERKEANEVFANAAFIVQAVNNHEALLTACKMALETMEFEARGRLDRWHGQRAALRAAIAQAEKHP